MTRQQRSALVIIDRCLTVNGVSPSFRELASALGLVSAPGAHRIVGQLIEQGLLTKLPNRNRTLQVTAEGRAALRPDPFDGMPNHVLLAEVKRRGYRVAPAGDRA